jgi:hypothetical protein
MSDTLSEQSSYVLPVAKITEILAQNDTRPNVKEGGGVRRYPRQPGVIPLFFEAVSLMRHDLVPRLEAQQRNAI